MRTALALLVFAFASCVQAEEATGRVLALYYEAARGVLVEARLAHKPTAIRWVDVELSGRTVLVQVPAGMNAAVGDIVAVRLAEPKSSQLAQILPGVRVARAVGINAGSEPAGASSVGR